MLTKKSTSPAHKLRKMALKISRSQHRDEVAKCTCAEFSCILNGECGKHEAYFYFEQSVSLNMVAVDSQKNQYHAYSRIHNTINMVTERSKLI